MHRRKSHSKKYIFKLTTLTKQETDFYRVLNYWKSNLSVKLLIIG